MMRKIIAALALLAMSGCGSSSTVTYTCSDNITQLEAEYGPAEEVTAYDDDVYHSRTYWYYRRGFSRTFAWGSSLPCTVNDSTFPPFRRMVDRILEVEQ